MEKLGGGGGFPGFLYETQTGGGSEREKKKHSNRILKNIEEKEHTLKTRSGII